MHVSVSIRMRIQFSAVLAIRGMHPSISALRRTFILVQMYSSAPPLFFFWC